MPSINPSRADLERLMDAARDARSAALVSRCFALGTGLRRLLRLPATIRPAHPA